MDGLDRRRRRARGRHRHRGRRQGPGRLGRAHPLKVAPTRTVPESRIVTAESGEAFGTIDPATSDAFLALVARRHGRSDFLAVDAAGRVTVAPAFGWVEATEAYAIGEYVAGHNAATRTAAAGQSLTAA